ncbi:MAG: serine hydrolase domain-containing protein [Bacteroidota bacterium]
MRKCWFILLLLVACKAEIQTEVDTPIETVPKYATYGYTGFTKEEKKAYRRLLLEGGSIRQGGDPSRFYFLNFSEIERHSRILRSDKPLILEEAPKEAVKDFQVPERLDHGGGLSLNEYIQQTEVDGLIIVHNGKIVFEGYPRMFPTDLHVNYSLTKIYVSCSVAILADRGLVDVTLSIDHYLEGLKGSEWEGISLKDILAMSSGMNPASSNRLFNSAYSTEEQIKALTTARAYKPPGTEYDYRGINTTLLTLLVEEISGLTFSDFLEREIWQKIGMEYDALLGKRANGIAATSSFGISSTLRDLARFGLAFTPSGRKDASPIISEGHLEKIRYVNEKLRAKSWYSEDMKCPGYQWDEIYEDGDFYKGGHGGQGLYISPRRDLVIAFYGTYNEEKEEHQLPAISRDLAKSEMFNNQ